LDLIYYLFHTKGWAPSDYYNKPPGEQDLILALASYEAEQMRKNRGC